MAPPQGPIFQSQSCKPGKWVRTSGTYWTIFRPYNLCTMPANIPASPPAAQLRWRRIHIEQYLPFDHDVDLVWCASSVGSNGCYDSPGPEIGAKPILVRVWA